PPYHHLGQVVGCASCDSLPQVHPGSALLPYTTLFRSTMAAIIEQHHDEKGIRWPVSVAPFHVVIVPVKYDDERQKEVAHELYERSGEHTSELQSREKLVCRPLLEKQKRVFGPLGFVST